MQKLRAVLYTALLVGLVTGNVAVAAAQTSLPLTDDFDDGVLATFWEHFGSSVTESNGYLRLSTDVTDQGAVLITPYATVSAADTLVVSRRTRLHYANNYFDARLFLQIEELPQSTVGVSYANYTYDGGIEQSAFGIHLTRANASARNETRDADVSAGIPGIWDSWFTEKLIYIPSTGEMDYYINDELRIEFSAAPITDLTAINVRLYMDPWGWWTGHYQDLDDFALEARSGAPAPTYSLPLVDDFDDGVLAGFWDPYLYTVTEANGYVRMSTDVTDQGALLYTPFVEVSTSDTLVLTRRNRLHYANSYFDAVTHLQIENMPSSTVGISYANYIYEGGVEQSASGIHLIRESASPRNENTQADVSPGIPGIWDTWFDETFAYTPATGEMEYYINGDLKITYETVPITDQTTLRVRLFMDPWGWWTGHYQDMDNFELRADTSGGQGDTRMDIVRRFAPIVYQDVSDEFGNGVNDRPLDLITSWDFDKDLNIENNWANADEVQTQELLPYVYYSVVETRTHYFLGYYFYHPRDWEWNAPLKDSLQHEHDLEGAVIVVAKPARDATDVVLMYTQAHGDVYYFLDPGRGLSLPDITSSENCLQSRDHRDHLWLNPHCDLIGSIDDDVLRFLPDAYGTQRVRVFIESNGHGVGQINRAMSNENGEFFGGDGVVYRPSPTGSPDPPALESLEQRYYLDYALLSFDAHIFEHRTDNVLFASAKSEVITTIRGFSFGPMLYEFRGGDPLVPDGAKAPWAWPEHNAGADDARVVQDATARGDWLFDPAYMVKGHVVGIPDNEAQWDTDYIHNPYLLGGYEISCEIPSVVSRNNPVPIVWEVPASDPVTTTPLGDNADLYLIDAGCNCQALVIGEDIPISDLSVEWTPPADLEPGEYWIELSVPFSTTPPVGKAVTVPSYVATTDTFRISTSTATTDDVPGLVTHLGQAQPNPFNPSTEIFYATERAQRVELVIYNLAGQRVKTLVRGSVTAGPHSVTWNGKDDSGRQVASGVYLYQLKAGDYVETKRMVLLK